MIVEKNDFTIKIGTTFKEVLIYQDENGAPIDLTGFTAKMTIRRDYGIEPIDTLTELDGLNITPVDGSIEIVIDAEKTSTYKKGTCIYDLQVIIGDEITPITEGKIFINNNTNNEL